MKKSFVSLFLWFVCAALAIRYGSVENADFDLSLQTRLPRVLLGSAIGMALATAGLLLQTLFQNPLCEPFTLGISSGSALGAVVALSFGSQVLSKFFPEWGVNHFVVIGALAGGLMVSFFLVGISRLRQAGTLAVLLVGVMLNLFCSSCLSIWMALSDPLGVQSAVFWLMGDLSRATLESGTVALGLVVFLVGLSWFQSRNLDGLLLGEEQATSLGVTIYKARRNILLLASALVALSVGYSGLIGFVGLMIPHFCRKITGSLHLRLLPLSALTGAWVLVLADLMARIIRPPYEIPTGVVTALIGAPIFIWVVLRERARL